MIIRQSLGYSVEHSHVLVYTLRMSSLFVSVTSTRNGSVLISTSMTINTSFISFGTNKREALQMHRSFVLKPTGRGSIVEFKVWREIILGSVANATGWTDDGSRVTWIDVMHGEEIVLNPEEFIQS